MSKLKVGILEDSKLLLKELKQNLDDSGLVEVIVWAVDTQGFFSMIQHSTLEALILDIDISGDSMNGLDVANKLELPVLFVSGKTKDFYSGIEELNLNSEKIVDHISKPITQEKLNKILPKFIKQIRLAQKSQFVYLDFSGSRRNKVPVSDIVFLESDKQFGADTNNKRVYFTNRVPETLVDFSFVKMEDKGLSKNQFITIHRSFRVNTSHILRYDNDHHVVVIASDPYNKNIEFRLPVSENYRKNVKRIRD